MKDALFDGVGNKYLPHFYFSARTIGLEATLAFTAIWAYEGWDSTVFSPYGVGVHWSSMQTFALFFYLLVVNMQLGGFTSLRQIPLEIRKDLRASVLVTAYMLKRERIGLGALRHEYDNFASVDGFRGTIFAFFFAALAMFAFENVWVLLYDRFQFGSWFWPIYYYGSVPFGIPVLNQIFLRNFLILAGSAFFGGIMLYAASNGEKGNLTPRFLVKWRFGKRWGQILILTIASWALWIIMPHIGFTVGSSDVISQVPFTQSLFDSTTWTFPIANYFPQTDYTFYASKYYLAAYPSKAIFGFYVNDWGVHLVNVTTKYLMFLLVCYPAMVRVKRNEQA